MSLATRSATRALYRDFYDLIPLFSSFSSLLAPTRRSLQCASIRTTRRSISTIPSRRLQVEAQPPQHSHSPLLLETNQRDHNRRNLPLSCPGCGALTQSVHPTDAGFYSTSRAAVKKYLDPTPTQPSEESHAEDELVRNALANVPQELREKLGMDGLQPAPVLDSRTADPVTPICDRCHTLIHHHSGIPINHPSLDAIEATIAESPHKYNHVYHVIDAADFPMSFIPALTRRLDFGWVRGRNRRAKTEHWTGGKSGAMSFIITRSDLLAPRKEQVDGLMPQLREILRDALGRSGEGIRLGNVRLVSAKRGWWTRDVKADVWQRGGANWLVGQANVGKSNIFEVIYPKGTNEQTPDFQGVRDAARKASVMDALANGDHTLTDDNTAQSGVSNLQHTELQSKNPTHTSTFYDTTSLLPPPQPESNYPAMPITSSLPGTTASPIRIPFGRGKGELIDLPGLSRRTLDPYVAPQHRPSLVMKQRVAPERLVLKPGASLVLGGGLVRITPRTEGTVFMVHAFVPVDAHATATHKAEAMERGERDVNIPSIVDEGARGSIKHAGTFKLATNVTKRYAGPLVRKDDVGLNVSRLPFVVWATDILIEGCGWVEVVAQVRKPRKGQSDHSSPAVAEELESVPVWKEAGCASETPSFDATWSPMDIDIEAPSIDNTTTTAPTAEVASWTPQAPRPDSSSPAKSKPRQDASKHPLDLSPDDLAATMPEIEVFSPEGRFVAQRPSLSCWLMGGPLDVKTKTGKPGRPRRSMKGAKKGEKRRARGGEAGGESE